MRRKFEQWSRSIKKMSTAQVVLLALSISLGFFAFWIVLTTIVWGILQVGGVRFSLWDMVEAVSTAAAVAQVFGGGIIALVQLTETADSRDMSIYNDVFEKMMSDENIEARRWIYQNLPDNPQQGIASLDPAGQAHIKRILNSFDHLGFLLQQDWMTSDPVIHWVSPMVVKVWTKLGPYIEHEITRRNEPDYYEAARELADRCYRWRRQQHLDKEIVWLKDAL